MMHFFGRWVPRYPARDAQALDAYWSDLRRGAAAKPSAGLPSDVADVAERLSSEIRSNDATDGFVRRLRAQLEDAHAAQAAQPDTRMWAGPAIGPNSRSRTPVRETEEQQIMSASTDRPVALEQRRWSKELWKIAAAVLAFAVVGALLVLLLRDGDDEPQIVQPGPTPTIAPTPAGTASASPSSTSTVEPEATSTLNTPPTEGLSSGFQTMTAAAGNTAATQAAGPLPDGAAIDATIESIPFEGPVSSAAFGAGSLWVEHLNSEGGAVISRVDPATHEVIATLDTGVFLYSASDIAVYVSTILPFQGVALDVQWIDPATNEVAGQLQGPEGFDPGYVAATSDAVWVGSFTSLIYRFDPATGELVATVEVDSPQEFAASDDAVWVPGRETGLVSRIDASTNTVSATVQLDVGIHIAQLADGELWIASHDGTLTRLNPDTLEVITQYAVPNADGSGNVEISGFAIDGDSLWVMGQDDGTLYRVDRATGEVIGSTLIGSSTQVVPVGDGSIWIYDDTRNAVLRITPN
jgi:outer membrane protein assembly factor BamB